MKYLFLRFLYPSETNLFKKVFIEKPKLFISFKIQYYGTENANVSINIVLGIFQHDTEIVRTILSAYI